MLSLDQLSGLRLTATISHQNARYLVTSVPRSARGHYSKPYPATSPTARSWTETDGIVKIVVLERSRFIIFIQDRNLLWDDTEENPITL